MRKRGKKVSKQRKLENEVAQQPSSSHANVSTPAAEGFGANHILQGSAAESTDDIDGTPSWARLEDRASKAAAEAPFGYVDAEVKAYFRAGYDRILELEAQGYSTPNILAALKSGKIGNKLSQDQSTDTEDELGLLLQATLQEMDGKELSLCTDPDTSMIVEGILHRLPAKPVRIYVDRLSGNFATLSRHRFGSHVVQATLSVLQLSTTLEHASEDDLLTAHTKSGNSRKRVGPSESAVIINQDGILRSATQLLLDITDELAPEVLSLAADPFGSHVLRTLLAVLTGRNVFAASAAERSKRSAKFRNKKASSNTIDSNGVTQAEHILVAIPDTFLARAIELRRAVLDMTDPTEVRRWAIDPVASPLLQLMIDIEAESQSASMSSSDLAYWQASLINIVLDGFVVESFEQDSLSVDNADKTSKRKDHLESSLRDSVASHVLQLALSHAPSRTVSAFYNLYIAGRMGKLCLHPAANHIVSALLRSLTLMDLEKVMSELAMIGTSMVKEQMVGCLQALVDRVASLEQSPESRAMAQKVSAVMVGAFELDVRNEALSAEKAEDASLLVPVVLALKTKQAYLSQGHNKREKKRGHKRSRDGSKKVKVKSKDAGADSDGDDAGEAEAGPALDEKPFGMDEPHELTSTEATMQGSLLLQSMLRLPGSNTPSAVRAPVRNGLPRPQTHIEPTFGCTLIYNSLLSLPTLVPFAKNAISVHVLIAALNPALPSAAAAPKRKLFTALLTHLAAFCGDKYGSRLAEYMWTTSDGYQREKLVTTVIEHSTELLKTQYAGFFTNKLNLQLYRKGRVREWAAWAKSQHELNANAAAETPLHVADKAAAGGSSSNRVVVQVSTSEPKRSKKKTKIDAELDTILQHL